MQLMLQDADWVFKCSNLPIFQCSNVPIFNCTNVQIFKCQMSNIKLKCSNVQMFKFQMSNVKYQMSNFKYQMSNANKVELLSERTSGVPPVIFGFIIHGMVIIPVFANFFPANYSKFGSWLFQDSWVFKDWQTLFQESWLFQVWQTLFLGVSAVPGSPWCSW